MNYKDIKVTLLEDGIIFDCFNIFIRVSYFGAAAGI